MNKIKFANKTLSFILFLVFWQLVLSFFALEAKAGINEEINYQGKLTDSSYDAVADGEYQMTFKIYDAVTGGNTLYDEIWTDANTCNTTINGAPTGGATTSVPYTETGGNCSSHGAETSWVVGQIVCNTTDKTCTEITAVNTTTNTITVAGDVTTSPFSWASGETITNQPVSINGVFSARIGSLNPSGDAVSAVNFNQDVWLGVAVEADSEMIPRRKIASVPSAGAANRLQTDATKVTSGNINSVAYSSSATLTGALTGLDMDLSTNVTDGNYSVKGINLTLPDSGSATSYGVYISGEEVNYFSGNVGIGTTGPNERLDISGTNPRIYLGDATAPGTTTNRLYSVSGTLYWNGIDLTAGGSPGGLDGQVQYNNGGSFGGASNLFYDDSTNRIGIGTTAPSANLHIYQDSPSADQILFQIGTSDEASRFTVDEDGDVTINSDLFLASYLKHQGDEDTYLWFSNDGIDLYAGGRRFLTLNESSTDQFIINDYRYDIDFIVKTDSNDQAFFIEGSSGNVGIGTATPGTAGLAIMNGNVGIGTTSPGGLLHIATDTTALGQTIFEQASADADSWDLNFRKTRGTVAVPTVITTADELGVINFQGYSGAGGYVTGAAIKAISEGTIATTRVPAHLSFWTGTDAAPTVLTERMRIDKGGNVGIGTTGPGKKLDVNGVARFFVPPGDTSTAQIHIEQQNSGDTYILGVRNSGEFTLYDLYGGYGDVLVAKDGNVGIGTTSPASLLDVTGGLTTTGAVFTLGTNETTVVANDILGRLNFYAPLEADGSDAILVGASIAAIAENTFSTTVNETGLQFSTGASEVATERMRIDHHGNVGIGTTNPGHPLDIEATSARIYLQSTTGTNSVYTLHKNSAGGMYVGSEGSSGGDLADGSSAYAGIVNIAGNYPLQFGTANNVQVTINSTGNVGIGTVGPTQKLDVRGNIQSANTDFVSGSAGSMLIMGQLAASGNVNSYIQAYDTGALDPADLVLQNIGGNVGIGTTSPSALLSVGASSQLQIDSSGNITTTGTTVTASSAALTLGGAVSGATTIGASSNITSSGGSITAGSGGNTATLDATSGLTLAGTARHARQINLNAEYPGAVLTTFYGAGTDTSITGTLTSDIEANATDLQRTYYEWSSSEASLNYYTVAVRVTLPQDFSAWATDNALQVDFVTETTDNTQNLLSVYVYIQNDVTTAVASDTANASVVADTWETVTIDDSVLDDGAGTEWDAASETAVIYLRMGSLTATDAKHVRVGDIKLNYLSKW